MFFQTTPVDNFFFLLQQYIKLVEFLPAVWYDIGVKLFSCKFYVHVKNVENFINFTFEELRKRIPKNVITVKKEGFFIFFAYLLSEGFFKSFKITQRWRKLMKTINEEIIKANVKSDHTYKDRLIRRLFEDKSNMLELCNAIMGTKYDETTFIKRYQLDSSLTKHYNDLAIGVDDKLLLVIEHQSKISPNMPLRLLGYVAELLRVHFIETKRLYGHKLFKIPTPKLYVLYNGKEKLTQTTLKLSNAFTFESKEVNLELLVHIIDVNFDSNHPILNKSQSLNGYSYLIKLIDTHLFSGSNRDVAISLAIKQCIKENILHDFLKDNYEEVANMLYVQYDHDLEVQVLQEEAMEEGLELGLERGLERGLEQGRINIALKMLANGEDFQTICAYTELSPQQISALKDEMQS